MNFSREGIRKEREGLDATAPRIGNRFAVFTLRVILYVLIATAVCGLALGIGAYQGIIADAPDITDANIMPLGYASFVYDKDGNQIQKLSSVEGNRVSIDISEIPVNMQHAIVAIEDSRFYQHNGVDPHGMIRAVMVALRSGFGESEGASTITQQLLKNNVFTGWMSESRFKRISRKIQEQYLAVQLEQSLKDAGQDPKQVVLQNYLNTVNFGSGAYGIQTAAQTYFGKNAADLTLSECAVLAAIPQNPSQYNPRIYPEDNALRMETVLDYMLEQGYISQEEHDEAMADNVYDRIQDVSQSISQETEVYSYFVDQLIAQVQSDLMTQKGYTEAQANAAIYNGGLQIYSTEDANVQTAMEEEFAWPGNFPASSLVNLDWALTVDKADGTRQNYSVEMMQTYFRENTDPEFDLYFNSEDEAQQYIDQYKAAMIGEGDEIVAERTSYVPQPQACMTVMDQATGQVVGIIGGRGEKEGSLTLNRATDSYRQPQSTLRILTTFAPALETNAVTLAKKAVDKPEDTGVGSEATTDDETHYGEMTIRQAIATSNNTISQQVLSQIGTSTGFEYLKKFGFTSLNERKDTSINLSRGSLTNGVTNIELTAAYAAIANGGTYNQPIFYTKVTDHSGNVILENKQFPRQILKNSTCYLLTSAMADVVNYGTGTAFQLENGIQVAGKTGTTDTSIDMQFVGFTPYYTAGIWTGYDANVSLSEDEKAYIATLWTKVMNRIQANLPAAGFTPPASVQELTVCADSGKLAGKGCKTVTEIFDVASAPKETCIEHIPTPTPTPKPSDTPEPTVEAEDVNDDDGDTAAPAEEATNNGGEGIELE